MARPRARRPEPSPLASAMWELVRRHVGPDTIRLMQVRDAWPRVAGSNHEAHTWPAAIASDTLIVHVHDSQWLHELTYMRQDLLRRLQALVPAAELGALRLRLGEVVPVAERHLPEAARPLPLPPPRLSPEPDEATRHALDAVHDPELKQILAGARIMLGRR